MKTKEELEEDILKITLKIQEKAPELSKYLSETPIKNFYHEDDAVTIENLKEYYDSLEKLLQMYTQEHGSKIV